MLGFAGDVAKQNGRSLEVPVGGGDVVVTEIGRQCQHVPVGAVAVGGDGVFERAHGEAMTQIVQPWARLAGSTTKTDLACKLDEHAGHDVGVDRSAGREDEQVLTRAAATLSDGEVATEGIDGAAKKGNEPRLVECCVQHFYRDRLVPLHESTRRALDEYLVARKRQGGPGEHLFVLAFGQPVRPDYLTRTFILLARKARVRGRAGEPGLRLHDLRHGFAVSALEGSLSSSRKDVARHMLALSTTLGHVSVTNTYWYLEATPVLMRQVSEATEKLHMTGKETT